MPTDIPIGVNLPDQQVTSPLDQTLENVIVSPLGVKMRPGSSTLLSTGETSAVTGLYHWEEQNLVVAVTGNGKTFKITQSTYTPDSFLLLEDGSYLILEDGGRLILEAPATVAEVSDSTLMATSGNRVTWANRGNILFSANGTYIFELHPTASQVSYDDGGGSKNYTCLANHTSTVPNAPAAGGTTEWQDDGAGSDYTAWAAGTRYGSGLNEPMTDDVDTPGGATADADGTVSFVGMADTYLLAIVNGTEQLWYSEVGTPWSWAGEYVSAEHLPDEVVSMRVQDGSVWVAGKRSIQVFENDGTTPWSPSSYGAISHGVLAPYSFVYCDAIGTFVWVDKSKRVVRLEGRNAVSMNPALDTVIQRVPVSTDCIADYIVLDGIPYYIMQFPSSEVTWVLNLSNFTYSEWISTRSALDYRYDASTIINVPDWDTIILGHTTDGKIKQVSSDYSTDDGNAINWVIRTPRINVPQTTRVSEIQGYFVRVSQGDGGDSTVSVRFRDDNKDWYTARTMTITDDNTDTNAVRSLYRMGAMRQFRQWEFYGTDLHPYAVTKMTVYP